MASRDFLKHVVSTSEPVGSALGDQWYNPATNVLSARLAVNGTSVSWVQTYPSATQSSAGGATLNAITAATANQTGIANGNFDVRWNWAKTADATSAFEFGEAAAATGGTSTSGVPNQVGLKLSTLAGSTMSPLSLYSRGAHVFSVSPTTPQILAADGTNLVPILAAAGNPLRGLFFSTAVGFMGYSDAGTEVIRFSANQARGYLGITTVGGTFPFINGLFTLLAVNSSSESVFQGMMSSANSIGADINLTKSRGSIGSPSVITSGDNLARVRGFGYVGATNTYLEASRITFNSAGTIADTATGIGGTIDFATRDVGGALTSKFTMTEKGGLLVAGAAGTSGQVLTSGGAGAATTWTTPGSGTVTSVSVATANGFAGTSSGGTTPALTLTTSITGLLKGNATAISAAVAGTDYQAAVSATGILKSSGVSGNVSAAVAGTDYVAPAGTFFIGTTSIAHNRASASLSMTGVNIDGSAGSATASTYSRTLQQTDGTTYLVPVDPRGASGSRATSLNANQYAQGLFSEFKNSGTFGFSGNYSGLITYANWVGTTASTGDPTYQLLFSPSGVNATANPSLRFRAGIDTTWGAWGEISHTQKTNLDLQHNSIGVGVAASTTAGQLSVSYQAALNTTTPGLTRYGLHLQGQTTADQANGITWNGGTGTTAAQAGIYVQGSGAYGTKMYIATTDSYATGSQTAISIDHVGAVQIARNNLTVNLGYIIESTATGLTAAGTTQGTALLLARQINDVTVVAASSGVRLPVAVAGMRIIVRNSSVTNLNVYPNTGAQIQSLGTNVAMVLVSATMLEYVAVSATQWYLMNNVYA